jgi:hypothetical protein
MIQESLLTRVKSSWAKTPAESVKQPGATSPAESVKGVRHAPAYDMLDRSTEQLVYAAPHVH